MATGRSETCQAIELLIGRAPVASEARLEAAEPRLKWLKFVSLRADDFRVAKGRLEGRQALARLLPAENNYEADTTWIWTPTRRRDLTRSLKSRNQFLTLSAHA